MEKAGGGPTSLMIDGDGREPGRRGPPSGRGARARRRGSTRRSAARWPSSSPRWRRTSRATRATGDADAAHVGDPARVRRGAARARRGRASSNVDTRADRRLLDRRHGGAGARRHAAAWRTSSTSSRRPPRPGRHGARARVWSAAAHAQPRRAPCASRDADVGVVCTPIHGETACGDGWLVHATATAARSSWSSTGSATAPTPRRRADDGAPRRARACPTPRPASSCTADARGAARDARRGDRVAEFARARARCGSRASATSPAASSRRAASRRASPRTTAPWGMTMRKVQEFTHEWPAADARCCPALRRRHDALAARRVSRACCARIRR